jgi:hypothetical protein
MSDQLFNKPLSIRAHSSNKFNWTSGLCNRYSLVRTLPTWLRLEVIRGDRFSWSSDRLYWFRTSYVNNPKVDIGAMEKKSYRGNIRLRLTNERSI